MFKLKNLVFLLLLFVLAIPTFAQDTLITLGHSDDLGDYLVGADGMTLYIYTPDPIGETTCYERCADNWPPMIVDSADDITFPEGIPGEFSVVERDNGDLNVAYNGLPLYYFIKDEAAGDTVGQGRGNVWWVVAPATVYELRNEELGHILVGPTGLSLYTLMGDEPGMGVSNCYDQCAENWPPLTVDSADAVVGDPRLPGELGTIERTDDTIQVTYNGSPLYYWKDDAMPGDIGGEGKGDVWYTVSPETVTVSNSDDLGDFLVAPNGMTLYTFANDEAGVSNCADTCLENWPAFKLYAGDRLVNPPDAMGELGTLTRDDDSVQITYNGMPLYFFAQDAAPGDTTGQGKGDVWFVAAP
jgi:predicted lipoprotein with Yx(FWY)xxD motif